VIVPWLSLKSTNDIGPGFREELFEKMYGVDVVFGENQDGSIPAPLVYDDGMVRGQAAYVLSYVDRYVDQALLRVLWDGKVRPVI